MTPCFLPTRHLELYFELYFPEEVHGAGLRLFDLVEQARLPDLGRLAESERLPTLREKFADLYDPNHPLRIALDRLQTLEIVRIIESAASALASGSWVYRGSYEPDSY